MHLSPGYRLGAYEILEAIGAGGMGEVYRGRDIRLNRDVAIKILPESFAMGRDRLARFDREAQVLASLNYPHSESGAGGDRPVCADVRKPHDLPVLTAAGVPRHCDLIPEPAPVKSPAGNRPCAGILDRDRGGKAKRLGFLFGTSVLLGLALCASRISLREAEHPRRSSPPFAH